MEDLFPVRKRTFEEVFDDHLYLIERGDFMTDMHRNFSPDILILTGFGVYRGYNGIKELTYRLEEQLPNARYTHVTKLVDKEMAFLEWTAISERNNVYDGVDTYLFKDGRIAAQTMHYTLEKKIS